MTELSPEDRLVLANMVANAQLEGHELPAEDLELAAAYLAGELDAATYEQRLLDLVRRGGPEARLTDPTSPGDDASQLVEK